MENEIYLLTILRTGILYFFLASSKKERHIVWGKNSFALLLKNTFPKFHCLSLSSLAKDRIQILNVQSKTRMTILLSSAASYCQLNNVLATWIIHSYYFYADNNFLYKANFVMRHIRNGHTDNTNPNDKSCYALAIYLHVSEWYELLFSASVDLQTRDLEHQSRDRSLASNLFFPAS